MHWHGSPFRNISCGCWEDQPHHTCLLIHVCWNVDRLARMEPPIQTEYFRFGGSYDLGFHSAGCQGYSFLLHPVNSARVHSATSRLHGVGIQILANIHIALRDRVERCLVDPTGLSAQKGRLENGFRTSKHSFVVVITCPSGNS